MIIATDKYTLAQVLPDSSLGAESSVVTPGLIQQIDGGATRGSNLFHSFEQFSLPTGGVAQFNNAVEIQNIISRVTGMSISNIDGLIQTNGTANFFLLNSNGIIFGPNARLDGGGSLVLATTASGIEFPGQGTFSTTPTNEPLPLLTVNPSLFPVLLPNQALKQIIDQTNGQFAPSQLFRIVGGSAPLDGVSLPTTTTVTNTTQARVENLRTVEVDLRKNLNLSLIFPDDVEPEDLIFSSCATRSSSSEEKNEFTITGTGGLPANPNNTLVADAVVTEWVTLEEEVEDSSSQPNSANPAPEATAYSEDSVLVEAQGWMYGSNGEVILTAESNRQGVGCRHW